MGQTKIYTTRKLEKVTTEFISENNHIENQYLGDWNSTLFYVSHKKCWLAINKLTKYILILPNVKNAELKNISSIFKETLYKQMIYDGIKIDYKWIDKIIGEVKLYETDNDRSASGSLNNIFYYIEDWKYEFETYENMPFRELNGRLNSQPNKLLNWLYSKEKMDEVIKSLKNN